MSADVPSLIGKINIIILSINHFNKNNEKLKKIIFKLL